jgi:hypothetical protein
MAFLEPASANTRFPYISAIINCIQSYLGSEEIDFQMRQTSIRNADKIALVPINDYEIVTLMDEALPMN